MLLKFLIVMIFLSMSVCKCSSFWWLFGDGGTASSEKKFSAMHDGTGLSEAVFAPFELSSAEQKFLAEAQHFLDKLPVLDQCNLLIINRLKSTCAQLTDDELSKLSVNLLNCQSAVEGRRLFPCKDDMKLADCTRDMDADTWNAYHIISNRARALCYSLRQTEFRMKTEHTVNRLAHSALENIKTLESLMSGQNKLKEATDLAIEAVNANQEALIKRQDDLRTSQESLQAVLSSNAEQLVREKMVISQRQLHLEKYSHLINRQLSSLMKEIMTQDLAKKEAEKEILDNLESVKEKATDVLLKLDRAMREMDMYHDHIDVKHAETIKNVEEIQKTIVFMNELLAKLYESVNEQLSWVGSVLGGAEDKLATLTHLFGHISFFIIALLLAVFLAAPVFTRLFLLAAVPLNCACALQGSQHLCYSHLAALVAVTMPAYWVWCILYNRRHRSTRQDLQQLSVTQDKKILCMSDSWSDEKEDAFRSAQAEKPFESMTFFENSTREGFSESMDGDQNVHTIDTATPCKIFERNLTSASSRVLEDSVLAACSPSHLLESKVGSPFAERKASNSRRILPGSTGSPRCCRITKSGTPCKNLASVGDLACRVHKSMK